MPTIGEISISCWVSLGPSGPEQGGCKSVGVFIGIVYIMPTIGGIGISCSVSLGPPGPVYGGLYVSWFLDCIYHTNNWGVVCKLFFTLVLFISCQQLGGYE